MLMISLWVSLGLEPSRLIFQHLQFSRSQLLDGLIVIRLHAVASALIVIRLRAVASALIMIRLGVVASALIVIRLHAVASALIVIWLRTVASTLIVIWLRAATSTLIVIRLRGVASALIVIRLHAVASALIVIRFRAVASALVSEFNVFGHYTNYVISSHSGTHVWINGLFCEEGVRHRGMTKATRHSSDTSPELFGDSCWSAHYL
ncbi:hypothetical protein OROMI_028870 [Orobanche minor]